MTKDEALRLALEALEKLFGTPPTQWGGDVAVWRLGGSYRTQQAITAIKQALAAPVQEPVAHCEAGPDYSKGVFTKSEHGAKLAELGWQEIDCPICGGGARAFPKPPQRTWVGLTDEEIGKLYRDGWSNNMEFARAVEAKLKERTHE